MVMHCEYYHQPMWNGQMKLLVSKVVKDTIEKNKDPKMEFIINKRTPFFDNHKISYEEIMGILFDLEHPSDGVHLHFPESKYASYKTIGDVEKDMLQQLTDMFQQLTRKTHC